MEGISKTTYKGKEILFVDYSVSAGSKEKILLLIKTVGEEYYKFPLKSILSLTNFQSFKFDTEVVNALRELAGKTDPYVKKNAVFGLLPVHKALYNFGFALTFKDAIKVFSTELEAKEWLVKD